jgi:SLT domain-containing protein
VLRAATAATVGFIANHWKLLGTILVAVFTGGIGLAVIALIRNWDRVRAATSALVGFLSRIWHSGAVQGMAIAARAAAVAVVAAFKWLAKAVANTFSWIFTAARNVAGFLMPVFKPLLILWRTEFRVAMWAIRTAVKVAMAVLVPIIRTAMKVIVAIMRPAWAVVRFLVRITADAVVRNAKRLASVSAAIFRAFLKTVRVLWGAIKAAVIRPVGSLVGWSIAKLHWFAAVVRRIWGSMRGAAARGWGLIKSAILRPVGSTIGAAVARLNNFKRTLSGIWGAIKRGAARGWAAIGDKMVAPIKHAVDGVKRFINSIIRAVNLLPGVNIKPLQIGLTAQQKNDRAFLAGHARGGMIRKPMAIVGEEAPRHPEIVIATNPRYRARNQKLAAKAASAVGLPGYAKGGQVGTGPQAAPEAQGKRLFPKGMRVQGGIMPGLRAGGTILSKLISEANKIDRKHYRYRWGGGHDRNFTPPYDCSGAVSAILHAAGLLSSPRTSGALAGFGEARGRGAATIYANPSHVFMSLAGKGWGTSNTNPGGGAGWLPYNSRGGFTVSHIRGVGSAMGMLPGGGGGGGILPTIGGKIGGLPKALMGGAAKLSSSLIKKGLMPLVGKLPKWTQGFGRWTVDKVANILPSLVQLPSAEASVGARKGAATRGQMIKWAKMALRATGLAPGGHNVTALLELARKESGWVTDSINTWDSNARAGNPSVGLMQVTLDKVGGSRQRGFDPVQNMIASIRYQMARYGHLVTFSPYAEGGVIGGGDLSQAVALAQGGVVGKKAPMGSFPAPNNLVLLRRGVALAKRTGVPPVDHKMVSKFTADVTRAGEMADLATNDTGQRMWTLRKLKAQMALRNWVVKSVRDAAFRQTMLSKMLGSYQGRQHELGRKRHPTHMEAAVKHAGGVSI